MEYVIFVATVPAAILISKVFSYLILSAMTPKVR